MLDISSHTSMGSLLSLPTVREIRWGRQSNKVSSSSGQGLFSIGFIAIETGMVTRVQIPEQSRAVLSRSLRIIPHVYSHTPKHYLPFTQVLSLVTIGQRRCYVGARFLVLQSLSRGNDCHSFFSVRGDVVLKHLRSVMTPTLQDS